MEKYTSRSASICVLLCFRKMLTQLDLEADAEEFEASPEYIAYPSFNMSCLETIQVQFWHSFPHCLLSIIPAVHWFPSQWLAQAIHVWFFMYLNGSSYGISQHTLLPCNSFVAFIIIKIFIIYYFSIFLHIMGGKTRPCPNNSQNP